jgi:hypothetical protein
VPVESRVPPDLAAEMRGLLAFAVLLLLPGILVVRAPWTAVPFLSASFWIVSWWWGLPRLAFLHGALVAFALLAVLRIVQPLPAARPAWPTLVVASAALGRLAPYAAWPVAPGADMSLHSLSTLLLVWHDGLPRTYEPLLPIHTFGAYTPGLHALAADVALVSGLPAYRSAFLVSVAAYGLLQIAVYAVLQRFFAPGVAALAAVLGLGMARVPQAFFGWGANPTVLALALVVAAAALLARGTGRSPAVAAGLFLGAAVLTHTMVAVCALAAAPLVAGVMRAAAPAERRCVRDRFLVAGAVALLAAAPFLARLHFTLSAAEQAWLADHLRTHYALDWQQRYARAYPLAVLRYVIGSLNDAFLAASLLGLVLALVRRPRGRLLIGLVAVASSGLLLVGLAATARWGGLGPVVIFPERALALLSVILCGGLAFLIERLWTPRLVPLVALAVMAGTAAERTHRYYAGGAVNVMVGEDDLAAMRWIESHTRPTDVVCNDYGTAGLWVPALAGRAISAPHLPPFYFDEFRAGAQGRACAVRYLSSRSFFVAPEPRDESAARVLFRAGTATIVEGGGVTSFDTGRGNPAPRAP